MARPKKQIPDLYQLKSSGAWCVNLDGRRVRLGRDEAAARTAYARLVAERLLPGGAPKPDQPAERLTVAQLAAAVLPHFLARYTKRGRPTAQVDRVKGALAVVGRLYGAKPAAEFGPVALEVCLHEMGRAGLSRGECNARLACVKRAWKRAVQQELIPAEWWQRLTAVEGLRAGSGVARETVPVRAVTDEQIDRTLPFLGPPVADMVRLQRLTAMRPTEVCVIRPCDLDRSGEVWLYAVPADWNKTAHLGRSRVVPLGPRAQAVLTPYLDRPQGAYCFSPKEAVELRRAARRAARKTRVQPSQVDRRKPDPAVSAGERYTRGSYARAVARACVRAGVPHWHPNQIRHTQASAVRKLDPDTARALLGHSSIQTTTHYAAVDLDKAVELMRRVG